MDPIKRRPREDHGCNCPHEVRSGCSDPECIHFHSRPPRDRRNRVVRYSVKSLDDIAEHFEQTAAHLLKNPGNERSKQGIQKRAEAYAWSAAAAMLRQTDIVGD